MKLGEKLRATVRFIGIFMLMALLALLAMPISVHADDMHQMHMYRHPEGGGTTLPAGDFLNVSSQKGAETSISAEAAPGYAFYYWTTVGSTSPFYQAAGAIGCSGLTECHAYFVKSSTTGIVAKSDDEDKGTAIGTKTWQRAYEGQYFTISATPKDPTLYEFDYWDCNGTRISGGATCEVQMPSISFDNVDWSTGVASNSQNIYTAHFKSKGGDHGFRAVINTDGGGIISGQPFLPYSSWKSGAATVVAEAAEGFELDGWYDQAGSKVTDVNGKITVTCPTPIPDESVDIIYTAKFKRKSVTGITTKAMDGSTSKDGGGAVGPAYVAWSESNRNQSISLTATPDKGMAFDKWDIPVGLTYSGALTNPTISIVMPDTKPASDLVITARFKTDEKFEVYTEVASDINGSITPGHGGTVNPAMIEPQASASEVTLVAEPHDGYEFDHWEDLDSGGAISFKSDEKKPKVTIEVKKHDDFSKDVHIRAVFRLALDDGIWALAEPGGSASPRYVKWTEQSRDTSFTITATPNAGYEFDHWRYYNMQTGMEVENYSTSASISVRMPAEQITEDIFYTAVFKKNNSKAKNKEIHVDGKETSITKESFLNKWRSWIDPALKYVRSTIQNMARIHTAGDVNVYEGNKNHKNTGSTVASELKAEIDSDNQFKHTQSFDHPVIMDVSGFSVSEVSGLNTVFVEGTGSITDLETESYVDDKFGELYIGEIVLSGDIYFENEKGERITTELSANSSDATVVMTGIDTASAARWMLVYKDSGENEFIITPITDATSLIRFTLPDQAGGKITLVSVNYR